MIKAVDKSKYRIPLSGHPMLHEELAWFATDDDKVIGVLIRDRIDHDFSWVALLPGADGGYRAEELGVSAPTADEARRNLHAAMEQLHR